MIIRNATYEDLPEILLVYAYARDFMRRTGNPHQWENAHPAKELLESDIDKGDLYVLYDGGIHAVFALIFGEDPTYGYIEGQWLNQDPYVTIHRIASAGSRSGMLGQCVTYALSRCNNLRIDTHNDNFVMQHLLNKHGFSRCGIIYLENGDPRIAYQITR